jgi:hypothetical protein
VKYTLKPKPPLIERIEPKSANGAAAETVYA